METLSLTLEQLEALYQLLGNPEPNQSDMDFFDTLLENHIANAKLKGLHEWNI